jgi:hypothetical protein
MRQVLVNFVPPTMFVLSGMVTSVTNKALFVQSGGLVGMGVPTVGVAVSGVPGVSVTAAVSDGVMAAAVVAGASVIETRAVAS